MTKYFLWFVQVAILETGKQIMLAVGVVNEGYNTSKMPGVEKGTVGYYTEGVIYDAESNMYGRGTLGIVIQQMKKGIEPSLLVVKSFLCN